jgi:hypothetical protein
MGKHARPAPPLRYRPVVVLVVAALAGFVAGVPARYEPVPGGGLVTGTAPAPGGVRAGDAVRRPGLTGPRGPNRPGRTCTVGPKLVPSCDVLWGAAAGGFSPTPRDEALRAWEASSGRTATIYHGYHRGDEAFPTPAEIAMAHDPVHPRLLLLNWRVDLGTTWARVAAGVENARIDREAARLRAFGDPFFLVLHHEPENDVIPRAGSGMTAKDFAAMYRYVVLRLRADGVTTAVTVLAYMNYERWYAQPWWPDLYPGDDVVDWLGLDTYLDADPDGFHSGDFISMLLRGVTSRFPGFYPWATTRHPGKPLMLAEWGVYGRAVDKPRAFATVLPALARLPAIKAMVYFDTAHDQAGRDIRIDSCAAALLEFQQVAAATIFDVSVH